MDRQGQKLVHTKIKHPYLRWAFGEAAVIAKRDPAVIGPLAQRLEAQMNGNKFKAHTVVVLKLARAVYFRPVLNGRASGYCGEFLDRAAALDLQGVAALEGRLRFRVSGRTLAGPIESE